LAQEFGCTKFKDVMNRQEAKRSGGQPYARNQGGAGEAQPQRQRARVLLQPGPKSRDSNGVLPGDVPQAERRVFTGTSGRRDTVPRLQSLEPLEKAIRRAGNHQSVRKAAQPADIGRTRRASLADLPLPPPPPPPPGLPEAPPPTGRRVHESPQHAMDTLSGNSAASSSKPPRRPRPSFAGSSSQGDPRPTNGLAANGARGTRNALNGRRQLGATSPAGRQPLGLTSQPAHGRRKLLRQQSPQPLAQPQRSRSPTLLPPRRRFLPPAVARRGVDDQSDGLPSAKRRRCSASPRNDRSSSHSAEPEAPDDDKEDQEEGADAEEARSPGGHSGFGSDSDNESQSHERCSRERSPSCEWGGDEEPEFAEEPDSPAQPSAEDAAVEAQVEEPAKEKEAEAQPVEEPPAKEKEAEAPPAAAAKVDARQDAPAPAEHKSVAAAADSAETKEETVAAAAEVAEEEIFTPAAAAAAVAAAGTADATADATAAATDKGGQERSSTPDACNGSSNPSASASQQLQSEGASAKDTGGAVEQLAPEAEGPSTASAADPEGSASQSAAAGASPAVPAAATTTAAAAAPAAPAGGEQIIDVELCFQNRRKRVRHMGSTRIGEIVDLHRATHLARKPLIVVDTAGFEIGRDIPLVVLATRKQIPGSSLSSSPQGILELVLRADDW